MPYIIFKDQIPGSIMSAQLEGQPIENKIRECLYDGLAGGHVQSYLLGVLTKGMLGIFMTIKRGVETGSRGHGWKW